MAPRAWQAARAYLAHQGRQDSHLAPLRSSCRPYKERQAHRGRLAPKATLASQENAVSSARLGL